MTTYLPVSAELGAHALPYDTTSDGARIATNEVAIAQQDVMFLAYGPFQPGTLARAIRHDNAARGYRTCSLCFEAFRSHRPARQYCSQACARAAEASGDGVQASGLRSQGDPA